MITHDILPKSARMYVEDTAAFCRIIDNKEIEWFDPKPLKTVGTEINTEKLYELWRKYQDSEEEDEWHRARRDIYLRFHDEPLVFGFIGCGGVHGEPSVHVCDILLHNWRFRTTMLTYHDEEIRKQFGRDVARRNEKRVTIAWVPDMPEAKAILMQFKLMMS